MTLPQATALQLESRQPTTAEILAYAAGRKKMWFSPQAAPRKQEDGKEAPVIVEALPARPAWECADIWFRSHVDAWLEYRSAPMKSYIKQRCRDLGIDYLAITGSSRRRAVIVPKHTLVYEVHVKFKPTYPELAALFGFTDHTSPLHVVQKFETHGRASFNKPRDHAATIKKMWMAGNTLSRICEETGCCESSVHSFVKRNGWSHL